MKKFLKKNRRELSKFMNIQFYPFTVLNCEWEVSFRIKYEHLDVRQKELADEYCRLLNDYE